jgi:hypothetical protein
MKKGYKIVLGIFGVLILASMMSGNKTTLDYSGPLTENAVKADADSVSIIGTISKVGVSGNEVFVDVDVPIGGWDRQNIKVTSGDLLEGLFRDPRIGEATVSINTEGYDDYGQNLGNIMTGQFRMTRATASKIADPGVYITKLDEIADSAYYHPNTK